MLNLRYLLLGALLIGTLVWGLRSPLTYRLFVNSVQHAEFCDQTRSKCVVLISTNGSGVDYVTSQFLTWGNKKHSPAFLPADRVDFELEADVQIHWQNDNHLKVEFEGGGHRIVGDIPTGIQIDFIRSDG